MSPLYWPVVGGAETHVRSLAQGLSALGHQVAVLTDSCDGVHEPDAWDNGVRVLRTVVQQRRPGKDEFIVRWEEPDLRLLEAIGAAITRLPWAPEVIHAHCLASFPIAALLKSHYNAAAVVTPHETEPERGALGVEYLRLMCSLPGIDAVIANGRVFQDALARVGIVASSVVSGLSFPPLLPEGREFHSPVRLISVARLRPRKNLCALIDAVSILADRGVDTHLTLICGQAPGSEACLAQLERRIAESGTPARFHVVVNADDSTRDALLSASDIAVVPSLAEGLGLVAVEALGRGICVISTPTVGAREVLQGFPEFLCEGTSAWDIARGVEDLIRMDSGRRQTALSNATAHVRREYSVEKQARRVAGIYLQLWEGARL